MMMRYGLVDFKGWFSYKLKPFLGGGWGVIIFSSFSQGISVPSKLKTDCVLK
jgi:hypothetical protein